MSGALPDRRIGVYVCHCGGNISDYVDVDRVIASVESEPGVKVARTAMFTCSDATQTEITGRNNRPSRLRKGVRPCCA